MIAAMFAGQGSQYVGMTADLVERFPEALSLANQAQEILGFDVHSLMANGPADVLTQTRYTQPALFLHESMVLAITGLAGNVNSVAGHSLGEFTALFAAGVLDFEDALRLVQTRGRIMYETGERVPGTMAAILGLDNEQVAAICNELSLGTNQVIVPANYNSTGQVVVSGSIELVRKSLDVFKERGARMAKELQVSGAFHSPLLSSAMDEWTDAVMSTPFKKPLIPVYNNTTAQAETAPEKLQQAAIQQMVSPVLWTQTLQNMAADGVTMFIEVGPQSVLQGLAKRTLNNVSLQGLDKASDCERYLESGGAING